VIAPRRLVLSLALAAGCGARSGLEVTGPDGAVDVAADVATEPAEDAAMDVGRDLPADLPVDLPVDRVEPELPVPDAPPPPPPPPTCGDGRLDPGEACDLGPDNALVPAFRLSPGARPTEVVQPVTRRLTAVAFYRYESASAHTGFESVGVANTFLYVEGGGNALSLFFFAGRDDDGSGASQPDSDMEVWFRGVPSEASVAVSDDNDELARQPTGDVRGRWSFNGNTDGGVLSGLPWDRPWRVVVEPTYRAGVTAARYVHRDGRATALVTRDSFAIEHFTAPARCRPDCRVPRCGDGFVDAGERCDDGNTASGDGCASNCQRIE